MGKKKEVTFKVGDRVRVVADGHAKDPHRMEIGDTATVMAAPGKHGRYKVGGDLRKCWVLPTDIELIDQPARVNSSGPETILEEAQRLTSGDRNHDYGHPADDCAKTGAIWGALLHGWAKEAAQSPSPIPVPPELACLCMVGVKLSRQVNKSKRDNLVDGAGYLRLIEMIEDHRKEGE